MSAISTSTPPSPSLPSQLGIYRIESRLGHGGMGEVYLAWDGLLERHVAIKKFLDGRLDDTHRRARFLREARAVARLDHPAIVRIHHVLERASGDCLPAAAAAFEESLTMAQQLAARVPENVDWQFPARSDPFLGGIPTVGTG